MQNLGLPFMILDRCQHQPAFPSPSLLRALELEPPQSVTFGCLEDAEVWIVGNLFVFCLCFSLLIICLIIALKAFCINLNPPSPQSQN